MTGPAPYFPPYIAAEAIGISGNLLNQWLHRGYLTATLVPDGWRRRCMSLVELVQAKAMACLVEQDLHPSRASLLARTLVDQELHRLINSARGDPADGKDSYLVVAVRAAPGRPLSDQLFLDVAVGAEAMRNLITAWPYDRYPAVIVLSLGAIMVELLANIKALQDAGRLPCSQDPIGAAEELLEATAAGNA